MEKTIVEILKQNGFDIIENRLSDGIATKQIETYLGQNEVQVYLSEGDNYNRTLSGAYFSADSLNHTQLRPGDSTQEETKKITNEFVSGVEDMIGNSYSFKLKAMKR